MKGVKEIFRNPSFPTGSWLSPEEQEQLVAALVKFGIIKISNKRDLPLKSGGMTDIYINLRDMRSHPQLTSFLADLFRNPLQRLKLDRFVEVPEGVSGLAGAISVRTGLPYVTVREEEKPGRVVKGKLIGELNAGERVAIIDDVITDGASKIAAYRECVRHGVNPSLVVLVDRQQGWPGKFSVNRVDMPVWAGITLHDIRQHLIQNFGLMERCDPEVEAKNPIIVALDGQPWDVFLPMVDRLRTTGCIFKVNDLLHDPSHRDIVGKLSTYGRVMVDFKAHDIPNTVANTCRQYMGANPPWAVTIHASGGEEMIHSALDACRNTGTKVLVVTVLTSIDPATSQEVYSRRPKEEVDKLAEIAHDACAHGIVCSPEEVRRLKKKYPDMLYVIPGIRSEGQAQQDQKRISTPAEAIKRGANHIVMGRQIFKAADPVAEVHRILSSELNIAL